MKTFRINLICLTLAFTFLVGCTKEDNPVDEPEEPQNTVTDIDGNIYTTVTIGTQIWMVENLKTTKYRNGDPIPNVTDNKEWFLLTTGAQCSYNNDAAISNKYGRLYNWYAVNDSRKLAPTGWHVPSKADIEKLNNFASSNIGTSGSATKALAAQVDWMAANSSAGSIGTDLTKNNSTGFSALPAGTYRPSFGTHSNRFSDISTKTSWWSSDEKDDNTSWCSGLSHVGVYNVGVGAYYKIAGFSVRCIKD